MFITTALAPPPTSTLSLHDALPISLGDGEKLPYLDQTADLVIVLSAKSVQLAEARRVASVAVVTDRKSTRLNSSHRCISYAVFCLKKKTQQGSPRLQREAQHQHPTR